MKQPASLVFVRQSSCEERGLKIECRGGRESGTTVLRVDAREAATYDGRMDPARED